MKTFIQIVMASIFSTNCLAAYWSPTETIPIQIDSTDGKKFTLGTPAGTQYEKGPTYYFYDGENWIQGVCIGNENGESQWAHMEYVPGSEVESESSPGKMSDSKGGYFQSEKHGKAAASAVTTGLAHALYRGFINTDEFAAEMNRLNSAAQADYRAADANYEKIRDGIVESRALSVSAIKSLESSLKLVNGSDLKVTDSISYGSPDAALVADLKELEVVLNSARSGVPKRAEARKWGLQLLVESDNYSVQGQNSEAQAFKRYAEVFADIAIGLDPVTGPLRDTYEAFTGKDLITGEKLDDWSRGFALVGALSFGFGSKIGKGLRVIRQVIKAVEADRALSRAVRINSHIGRKIEDVSSPKNRAVFEKYLRELRQNMEKPAIQNTKLKGLVDWYWRDTATIGNGSTAAALRFERLTGESVKGATHGQKAVNAQQGLKNWLKANPHASSGDRAAAENILKDLELAIGGE